jgi:HEAT repeat protein
MSGMMDFGDDGRPRRSVKKEVGFLFHVPGARAGEIDDLVVSNLSLKVDLDGDPLVWLGGAGYDESVSFLEARFDDASTSDAREEFLMAVGLHDESKRSFAFLKKVLLEDADPELREDAAFWLGQAGGDEARTILTDVAWKDRSESIREKAIFSLSQMEDEASVDALIALAKGHEVDDTRKQASFWLGQKASDKALGALRDIAYEDEDSEVQRSAMFALTQIEGKGGVDELIKIARTHSNPKIRKDAIFWLGQSDDPRALEVLVEIVKGK